jgi:hypothetical protein
MRVPALFILLSIFAISLEAQVPANYVNWFSDDFASATLHQNWNPLKGNWTPGDGITATGGDHLALLAKMYLPRQQNHIIECAVKTHGGVVFGLESPTKLAGGHFVHVNKNMVVMGYFDFSGAVVETRTAEVPEANPAIVAVHITPDDRLYRVVVNGKDLAYEELRYVSGFAGLYGVKSGASFSSFRIVGAGRMTSPAFYLKSNKTQIDQLSYMTLLDNALLIANPAVGMVQRISGVGTYICEVPVNGPSSEICGVAVDDDKWMYVADKGLNTVHIFSNSLLMEKPITSDLNQPVGVAASKDRVFVLDAEGIKVFDKTGTFLGAKAKGMFKNPKNIWLDGGTLYVADFGNGDVKVLDADSYSLKGSITQDLSSPWDVFVDPQDRAIYVADPGAYAVFKYDQNYKLLERIDPITMKGFISPRAVRVKDDRIFVADFSRILVFKKGAMSIRPTNKIQ